MTIKIINADVMDGLAQLADESVHCVVTSPPYWGLRDYGAEGQIGLEPTLAEHIAKLVDVFREVRRVLRNDGVMWLNYGDGYAASTKGSGGDGSSSGLMRDGRGESGRRSKVDAVARQQHSPLKVNLDGFKPKDLLLMPERLAIALCDDGWYIRSRIIWHKPNPMPESVTDRPTKSHEHIWLMSKAPRYFYDAEAIAEPAICAGDVKDYTGDIKANTADVNRQRTLPKGRVIVVAETRNARDVWTIATSPFAEAHFATFPPELAERCIKAGTSEGGCCPLCGAPWQRRTARASGETTGWWTSCTCNCAAPAVPCTVLDPFGGSGTTGLVADRLQRNAVLIELNPQYAAMAKRRLTNDAPLFAEVAL